MDSEIELKLLVAADAEKKIRKQFIPALNADYDHESIQLCNIYYDTDEHLLRKHGMGLRVRGNNGEYEQTIKSKDGSVGGLHKRAEYNVSLNSNSLDIALFPNDIWPTGLSPDELNSQLTTLFTTHFRREQYLINLSDKNKVELVFDSGDIETEKYQTPVCEIELELKKGSPEAIFELARKLLDVVPFRLGYKSKAQRGYELMAGDEHEHGPMEVHFLLKKHDDLQHSFLALMGDIVGYWQFFEQRFVESQKPRDLIELVKVLRLAERTLQLFEKKLKCNELTHLALNMRNQLEHWAWVEELAAIKELLSKKGFYRKKLVKHDNVMKQLQKRQSELLETNQPLVLLHARNYILLQLQVLELLTLRPWSSEAEVDVEATNKFAKKAIREELRHAVESFDFAKGEALAGYLAGYAALGRVGQLHTLLNNVIGTRTVSSLETWIDLLDGAEELKVLNLLEAYLRKIMVDSKDGLIQWCVSKQESLVNVMELNRTAALSVQEE